tara:strand:- start:73 stop:813 length:741 start_codon:yes stop_codon:yes gene_type:complete
MKKMIIMMGICASLFAQQAQTVGWNRMFKPKVGEHDAFIKAVSDKTKKYNTKKGTAVIRTYQVINGPNGGSFVRSGLAGGWEQFDNPPSNWQAGIDYWRKNVMPFVEEAGAQKIWELLTEVSYNGTGETGPAKLYKARYYHLKPGTSMLGLARKIKEALVATKSQARIGWYRLESGGDRSTWVVGTAHDTFESLGNDQGWRDAYEQHHGKGSLQEFNKEFGEIVQSNPNSRFAENYRYRPDMSSPE